MLLWYMNLLLQTDLCMSLFKVKVSEKKIILFPCQEPLWFVPAGIASQDKL